MSSKQALPGTSVHGALDDTRRKGRSGLAKIVEYAVHELHHSERLHARDSFDRLDAIRKPVEAERAKEDAERLLKPPAQLIGDPNTEIVPARNRESDGDARLSLVCTLETPDLISVDASEHRASLATRANVLSAALDAAQSVKASSSIEKMLTHQMAATHNAGMSLLIKVEESAYLHGFPPVEIARLTNAAARLFEVYQGACETLVKLRTKGTTKMLVQHQHVTVEPGGQAIVAAKISRGSRGREATRK